MDPITFTDRFSLNSHGYLLKTTDETEAKQIVLRLFRHGQVVHSFQLNYDTALAEHERQQLAAQYHQRHREELAKLFHLHGQHEPQAFEAGTRYLIACGFLKYGMVQEAIANLEYLVEIRKGSPLVRAALGKAHLKIQNYEPALEQFRRALSANENYADLHFYCGVCEYYLQHCSAAVHSFSRAIKINPHYGEAYVFFSLALLLNFKLGQEYGLTTKLTERTQKAFQRARAILPSLGGADFDKGIALLEHEKFEEAFGVFEPWISKISSDKPEVINYEFHLAVLHEAEQIPPERVWQEIIRLQNLLQRYPNYADVYYELGFAYAVLGSSVTSKSLHHFEKAMAINPDYENARKGLKLIQNDQRGLRTMLQAMLPIRATLNHEQKS